MQINHLRKIIIAIDSWLSRSRKACIMRNEGFLLYDGSCYSSHNYVSYQEGHDRPYSIDFQSEGQWSNDFNKTFTLSNHEDRRPGWVCDSIPRVLIKRLLAKVEYYLPLPEWAYRNFTFISFPDTFNGYDEEGNPLFLTEEQWKKKYEPIKE